MNLLSQTFKLTIGTHKKAGPLLFRAHSHIYDTFVCQRVADCNYATTELH